ncbi:MAG: hypothetical protein OHK0031_11120 [Anaerolineales bacterium]
MKKVFPYLVLLTPVLLVWGFWALRPSYWFNSDPAAWYFLDSLAIFSGKPYQYVDHPGTPLHLIGSLLLGLTSPFFASRADFLQFFIARPEIFFFMTNLFLLAMNIITLLALYQTIISHLKINRELSGISLAWMYFALHPQGFSSLTYWSHNSFNFIFGTLWLIWLYRAIQEGLPGGRKIFLLGAAAGALAMTQLYLLAWLAGGFVTIFSLAWQTKKSLGRALKASAWFLAGGLSGIGALLLPIINALPRLISWLTRLLENDGLYGSGQQNFYSLALIPDSLIFWAQAIPLVLLALVLALILLIKRRQQPPLAPPDSAMRYGMLIQTALLLLALSKMFYRVRYTLALAAILPILFLLALKWREQNSASSVWLTRGLLLGVLLAAGFSVSRELLDLNKRAAIESEAARARSLAVTLLARRNAVPETSLVIVYGFGTPLKCAGLLLANNWLRAFDQEIGVLCPNQFALYDFAFDVSLNSPYPAPAIETIPWDMVIWPGNGSSLPAYLQSVGAENIPKGWGVNRGKWFFIRPGGQK